jgi:hypothetical protein
MRRREGGVDYCVGLRRGNARGGKKIVLNFKISPSAIIFWKTSISKTEEYLCTLYLNLIFRLFIRGQFYD